MVLIHGAYHFWPKRVAFRNDYCLYCRGRRGSIASRTFDVGHVFWIPILPVGLWKHWRCTSCGRDPHVNPYASRSSKWAWLVVLIGVAVIFWTAPITQEDAETIATIWAFRIGAPTGAMLLLRHVLRASKEPSLRQMLKTIPPATDTICPFCKTPLVSGARWSCPGCGVVRR
jgi:hypothetical protein